MFASIMRRAGWILAASLVVISACSEDEKLVEVYRPTGNVTFALDHNIGGVAFTKAELGQMNYNTSKGTNYSINKMQYVISHVTLHATDGTSYGMSGVHFRDIQDDATRESTLSGVPAGTYDMVSFTFGLDAIDNVRGKFAGTDTDFHLALGDWPTILGAVTGYHYMKIEGNFIDDESNNVPYATHTGARQLDGTNPMFPGVVDDVPYHHFFRVELPITPAAIDGNNWTIEIDVDLGAWYEDHDAGDGYDSFHDWDLLPGQMIMGNLAAQMKLMTNGPTCFTAKISSK